MKQLFSIGLTAAGLCIGVAAAQEPVNAEASAVVSEVPAPVAAAGNIALPDLDPDAYFDGSTGGTFGKKIATVLPNNKRVAVVGFRVVFVTENSIKAQVRASYLPGRDRTGAHASMNVALQGVDNATLQAITDKAYATFLQQLAAAGREVVPLAEIEPLFASIDATPTSVAAPYSKQQELGYGKRTGSVFTPAGLPLWWTHFEGSWGNLSPFKIGNWKAFSAYSKDLNAFTIAPLIVVDFAEMQSSGNRSGLMSREASVAAELGVSVAELSTGINRADEARNGMLMKGDQGSLALTQAIPSELPFASMEVTEEKKTTGLMAVMTGSSKSKSKNLAVTDDARYGAAAEDALTRATGALAKFFQKHS